jgi:DNA mismatch repair protein MutS
VKRWEDRIVFMHQISPGGCDDSYGVDVARLAGLPRKVVTRARQVLRLLESGKFNRSELGRNLYVERVQPTLFDAPPSEIEEEIKKLDIDSMTPIDALNLLRDLQGRLK